MDCLVQMGIPDVDVRWVGAVQIAPPNNGSALAATMMRVRYCSSQASHDAPIPVMASP